MKKKTKIAAGGVIYREMGEVIEILSIRQKSHGGWCFPKGHQDDGEELRETALREVAEETGFSCEIVAELPMTSYHFTTSKGRIVDKRVSWYLMRPGDRVEASHAHEVLEMRWVDPEELPALLSYESDRGLLHDAIEIIDHYRGG